MVKILKWRDNIEISLSRETSFIMRFSSKWWLSEPYLIVLGGCEVQLKSQFNQASTRTINNKTMLSANAVVCLLKSTWLEKKVLNVGIIVVQRINQKM